MEYWARGTHVADRGELVGKVRAARVGGVLRTKKGGTGVTWVLLLRGGTVVRGGLGRTKSDSMIRARPLRNGEARCQCTRVAQRHDKAVWVHVRTGARRGPCGGASATSACARRPLRTHSAPGSVGGIKVITRCRVRQGWRRRAHRTARAASGARQSEPRPTRRPANEKARVSVCVRRILQSYVRRTASAQFDRFSACSAPVAHLRLFG